MCRRHERTGGVSLVFMVVLVVWAVSAETCDDLQCLNSNPCMSFLKHDNTIHARCVCGGQWAGRRCQHQIRLQPQDVTSSQARFKVQVMTSRTDDVTSSRGSSALSLVSAKGEEVALNYTLVYWQRNDTLTSLAFDWSFLTSGAVTCVLLHRRNSREPVLEGLLPSTRYTICVENGFVDSCVLSSFTQSSSSALPSSQSQWPSNCVTIYTPRTSPPRPVITKYSTVTVVAVVSVFVLALLVVVFVVFLLRRNNVAFRLLTDSVCGKCGCLCCTCCGRNGGGGGHGSQDRTRLSHSSSQISRTTFLDDDIPRDSRATRKKSLLRRLRPCQKKPKSSTYTSANMLLAPPPSSQNHSESFSDSESLPLGFDLVDDDCVFENLPSEQPSAVAALPALRGGRNKPIHRLSRKRRGYVTYSTRKDKNIRLTTVLESPMGDDDDDQFGDSFLNCSHSSV